MGPETVWCLIHLSDGELFDSFWAFKSVLLSGHHRPLPSFKFSCEVFF